MSFQPLDSGVTVSPFTMVSMSGLPTNATGIYLDADPAHSSCLLQTAGVDALYADKYQNIGINTRAPAAQLDINGTTTHLKLTYNNTINNAKIDVSSDGKLSFYSSGSYVSTDNASSFDVKAHNGMNAGLMLGGVLVTATAAQLNSLASGGSAGNTLTVADTITITNANGVDKGLILGSTLVTSSAAELNYLDGSTPGTAVASKALVLDSNKAIVGISNLSASNLTISPSVYTYLSSLTNTTGHGPTAIRGVMAFSPSNVGVAIARYQNPSLTVDLFTEPTYGFNSTATTMGFGGGETIYHCAIVWNAGLSQFVFYYHTGDGMTSYQTLYYKTSSDGTSWSSQASTGLTLTWAGVSVAYHSASGTYIAFNRDTFYYSTNGISGWTSVNMSSTNVPGYPVLDCIQMLGNYATHSVCANSNTYNVMQWNGTAWVQAGTVDGTAFPPMRTYSVSEDRLYMISTTSINTSTGTLSLVCIDNFSTTPFSSWATAKYSASISNIKNITQINAKYLPNYGVIIAGIKSIVIDANNQFTIRVIQIKDKAALLDYMDGPVETSGTQYAVNSCISEDYNETLVIPSMNSIYSPTVGAVYSLKTGSSNNFTFGSTVISESEIAVIDGVTAGTASASKALIVDGSRNISNVGNVSAANITSTTGTLVMGTTTIAESEIATIDGVTAGTASASKALIVDSNKDITGVRNLSTTGIISTSLTTDSSSISTGAVTVAGGVGIAKKLYVGGIETITDVTESSSISTGALVVNGGVGIAKKLTVGGVETITDVTESSSISTGALVVDGGVGIAKNLNVAGVETISNTTESSSTIDGALVIAGGVGIAKKLNVGGIETITDVTDSSSISTGALVVDGGVGIAKKLTVGGVETITDITNSSSITTGALVVNGGVGIALNVVVGGDETITSTTESTTVSTGALVVDGGVGVAKKLTVGGIETITNITDSSSTTTGALVVTGGVGIGAKLTVGGAETISDATDSSSTSTGALIVAGGVGVAKKLTVGDIASFTSSQDSSSVSTGAVVVTGGVGIGAKLTVGGIETITDTTESTTVSTGALVIAGGVGIAKKLTVGGIETITDTTESTTVGTGALVVDGGVGIAKKLTVGGIGTITDTTESSSTSTGALVVTGGVGIGAKLTVGGAETITDATESTTVSTGALTVAGGVGIAKKLTVGGVETITDTTESSSVSTGALVVDGGVGIAKKLTVGGITAITDLTGSTSTSTGALTVAGGAGIAENLFVGGNATITGNLTVSGTTTTVNTETITVADNTITVNSGPSGSGKDGGLLVQRYQIDNNAGTGDVVSDIAKYTTTIASTSDLSHITLATGASAVDNYYNDWWIKITSGAANNNVRKVIAYNGTTKVATLSSDLSTAPATDDTISMFSKTFPTFIWQEASKKFIMTFAPIDSSTTINTQDYADIGVSNATINATTGSTSKTTGALIVSGGAGINENLYIGGVLDVVAHDGSTTGLKLNGTLVTSTAAELNYVDVTAGTATASKALVLDSSSNISGINKLSMTSIRTGTPANDALPMEIGYVSYQYTGAFAYSNSNNAHGLVPADTAASANYSMRTDGRILCTGEIEITSDHRLKENIEEITSELSKEFVMTTTPVRFNWRSGDNITDYGYIAQDVYKKGFTDLVTITPSPGMDECIDDDGFISPKDAKFVFSPGKIIPLLALNQREVFKQIEDKNTKIGELEDRIAKLEELINKLTQC